MHLGTPDVPLEAKVKIFVQSVIVFGYHVDHEVFKLFPAHPAQLFLLEKKLGVHIFTASPHVPQPVVASVKRQTAADVYALQYFPRPVIVSAQNKRSAKVAAILLLLSLLQQAERA